MKISIITPTLNSEKYLECCIASINRQSYKNIEHIVVDGASTDGTIALLQKYPNIKWVSEPDNGMYAAINKGIELCTGDIVGVLNSDDIYAEENVLEKLAEAFKLHNTDCVYGNIIYVSPADENKIYRKWISSPYKYSRLENGWMPPHPSFYHKRQLFKKFGGYKTHFYTSADYELMLRYLYTNKATATYLDKYIVKMRTGGLSNGGLLKRLRANRRDYLALKSNGIKKAFIASLMKPIIKIPQYFYT